MSTEFASLGERDFLITENDSNTIEHIRFRPFGLLNGSKRRIAAPLFMVKRRGGALEAFTRSRDTLQDPLASEIEAVSGIRLLPTPPLNVLESTNLEWLAGHRFTRFDPDPDSRDQLVRAFATPTSLGAGLRRLRQGPARRPELASMALNLMWRRILTSRALSLLTPPSYRRQGLGIAIWAAWLYWAGCLKHMRSVP